ncbi:MAG TPA: phosphotransferase [Gaiellaceae bacterium]
MTELVRLVDQIDEEGLVEYVTGRRWFGAKSREVVGARVLEATAARSDTPGLVLALVEIRFLPGTHEIYQVPFGLRPQGEWRDDGTIGDVDGWTAYDAMEDPELARELVRLIGSGETLASDDALLEFRTVDSPPDASHAEARPMGVEQSNTSVVFDERLVLKLYRRLEAGINPELELLRFLTERGFSGIAALEGWAAHSGRLMDATLAILQNFIPGQGDGWTLAFSSLESGDPADFLSRLRSLGEVTGSMHTVLGSEAAEPSFSPEEPSAETLSLLTATIDEEIEQVFANLPELPELEPIAGRGEDVREHLRARSQIGGVGRVIRHHGDYHLGQVLWTREGWIVIDFEGEPARSLPERRRKRSPLRDVAGMLRSFAYVASAAEIAGGSPPPEGWEQEARTEFLAGYRGAIEPTLVPAGESFDRLLAIFELEKAVYELRYELDNRPNWVPIPVAGIVRLLESAF